VIPPIVTSSFHREVSIVAGDHGRVIVDQLLGFGQQQQAFTVELDLTLAAIEQRAPDLILERTHLLPDGGIGQGHSIGCGSKTAVLRDGNEGFQKTDGTHWVFPTGSVSGMVKGLFMLDKGNLDFLSSGAAEYWTLFWKQR